MTSIELKPDFGYMRKLFLSEFVSRMADLSETADAETIREVCAVLVPLNIALQAVDTAEALESFRREVAEAVTLLASLRDRLDLEEGKA